MLNLAYIANLEKRINSITSCQELALLNQEFLGYIISLQSSVAGQVGIYSSLIIAPTDLGSALTWISKMITTFTGVYAQALAMETQLVGLEASVIALISSKMGTLACARMLQSDLNRIMRIPNVGSSISGLSVFGGG